MASMIELGQVVQGRYRIDELLGKGGMGAVYRAHDLRLDTSVAIKENLEFDERSPFATAPAAERDTNSPHGRRAQFEREAKILARLRHHGLPSVTDHFVVPGQGQYLVMEFVHGKNLSEIMAERGRFAVGDAVQVTIDVCRVLEYLHGQSPPIIHRDLKPANLRLTPQGRVIVVDFGIAKEGAAELTQTGALGVTPGFSPMEQYAGSGQTDARSDVYALGATLYSLLSDEAPPAATARALGTPVIPLTEKIAGVSRPVQAAVDRAMSLNPKDRFPSAAAFREALEKASATTSEPRTTPAPRGGITAPIVPEGRSSEMREARGRRRGFFDAGETDPVSSAVPPTAPLAPSDSARDAESTALAATADRSEGSLRSGERAHGSGVRSTTTRDLASSTQADRAGPAHEGSRSRSRRRIATGSIAILVALLISALGYAVYRGGYLPWGSKQTPSTAVLWSAIELHLLENPNDMPSASNLMDRIDERSAPVAGHAASALLSDRALAGKLLDGESLTSLARSRSRGDLPCGRMFRVLASGISTDGISELLGSASFESDPCPSAGPKDEVVSTDGGADEIAHLDTPPVQVGRSDVQPDEAVRSNVTSDPSTREVPDAPRIAGLDPVRIEGAQPRGGTVVDLRWSRSPSPFFLGYDVHLATTPDFPPSATKSQTVSAVDRTSLEWIDLACNTTYYVRVVVRDTHGQSAASTPEMVHTPACGIPHLVRIAPSGGDFSDLLTAFERINQDSNVPSDLRIELAPGTYSMASDLWLGKSVVLVGSEATLRGRIVTQAPRIELIGVTIESTGKSAVNVPSGELLLRDCVIRSQTHPGVEVLGNGSLEMRNTTIRDCGSKGLLMRDRARAVVYGGTIEGNESGIDVGDEAQLWLHGTAVTRSGQSGVYLHDNGSATIDQGAAIGRNGFNGIFIATGGRLDLNGASVRENQQAGIVVEAGGIATLRDCDLTGNVQGALEEDPGSHVTREGEVRTR